MKRRKERKVRGKKKKKGWGERKKKEWKGKREAANFCTGCCGPGDSKYTSKPGEHTPISTWNTARPRDWNGQEGRAALALGRFACWGCIRDGILGKVGLSSRTSLSARDRAVVRRADAGRSLSGEQQHMQAWTCVCSLNIWTWGYPEIHRRNGEMPPLRSPCR